VVNTAELFQLPRTPTSTFTLEADSSFFKKITPAVGQIAAWRIPCAGGNYICPPAAVGPTASHVVADGTGHSPQVHRFNVNMYTSHDHGRQSLAMTLTTQVVRSTSNA
jgi:hypothetical protein